MYPVCKMGGLTVWNDSYIMSYCGAYPLTPWKQWDDS